MVNTYFSSLKGNRIYLRSVNIKDADALYNWSKNNLYHDRANLAQYKSIEQAKAAAEQYEKRKYSFAISLIGSDQMIGIVELYEHDADTLSKKSMEVGFLLDKTYWHHGY